MLLVVDANVLFSALIAAGKTSELIFSGWLRLVAPEFLFRELEEHRREVLAKSSLTQEDFARFVNSMEGAIEVVPRQEFEGFLGEANRISPDPDDTEYLALALRLDAAIWSNDQMLKKQSRVRVFSTQDIVAILERTGP